MSAVVDRPPLVPDERGRFGTYGGRYVPEVLIPALDELADRVGGAPRRPGVPRQSSARCCATSSAARPPSRTRDGCRRSSGTTSG